MINKIINILDLANEVSQNLSKNNQGSVEKIDNVFHLKLSRSPNYTDMDKNKEYKNEKDGYGLYQNESIFSNEEMKIKKIKNEAAYLNINNGNQATLEKNSINSKNVMGHSDKSNKNKRYMKPNLIKGDDIENDLSKDYKSFKRGKLIFIKF